MSDILDTLADLDAAAVLAVARHVDDHIDADLGVVQKVRRRMAIDKAVAERLAALPITDMLPTLEDETHSSICDAVADACALNQALTADIRDLLEGERPESGLLLLYAIAFSSDSRRTLRKKNPPAIPEVLLELRDHPAVKAVAKQNGVQKGRAKYVRSVYKRRHG